MERPLALSFACAAAAHLGLLFGIPPEKPLRPAPPSVEKNLVEIVMPPPSEDEPPAAVSAADAGAAPSRPSLDDVPHLTNTPVDFTIAATSIPSVRPGVTTILPSGIGAGIGDAIGVPRGAPFDIDMLDNPPRTRVQAAPVYPFEARRDGRAGQVIVEFTVDETGAVVSPRVIESNDRIFEEPTLRAVSRWRFEPGKRDGRVVRFRMTVPVVFSVN